MIWRNARLVRQDRKKEVWVGDESSGVGPVRVQSIDPENFSAGVLVDMPQSTCGGPLPIVRLTKRSTICRAALQGVDMSMPDTKHPYRLTKGYIVSDAFLKNWYSIFNYDDYLDEGREGGVPASVSFAKAI